MADILQQVKAVSVDVNGQILLGIIEELDIADMELETEEVRLGGMDGTVEVETGQMKMDTTIKLKGIHKVLAAAWGTGVPDTKIIVRGAIEDYDGTVSPVQYTMIGLATAYRHGDTLKGRGELPTTELVLNANFYEHKIDGETIQKIDFLNMIREIDGTDRLAAIRAAIGA